MPTLRFTFPGRRYHATLWGHHANEGQVEWPPCPWRILRALLACGFNKGFGRATASGVIDLPPVARSLLEKLASVLPSYGLPEASAAHTRHYMPYISGKDQKTTLVWDTFADVGNGELLIHYPCELNSDERDLLAILTRNLGYLGRAESWVDGELVDDASCDKSRLNAFPCEGREHPGQKYEQIALTAPVPPVVYLSWQRGKAESAVAHLESPSGTKKLTKSQKEKERRKLQEPFPPDLLTCLTKDTSWWKGHGWSQPPGSQRKLYWRRSDPLEVGPPVKQNRRVPVEPVKAMLLAMTTPSGNMSALPPLKYALREADKLHRRFVSRAAKISSTVCSVLTGTDHLGRPLRDGHRHAHILPIDLDGDGHIDHFLVHAPMGLDGVAQSAIRRVDRTWAKGGVGDLQLAVVGQGSLADLRKLPDRLSIGVQRLIGPHGGSKRWVSLTPFVAPRHLKREGKKDGLADQVNAELRSRGMPEAAVSILDLRDENFRHLRHFMRSRAQRAAPPADVGYAIELNFAEQQPGPICLGYAAHFGLGQFAPGSITASD